MRYATAALIVLGLGIATVHQSGTVLAQAPTEGQPPAATPGPAPAAAPAAPASPVATVPTFKAKDLEGLDAFGSDGQQVGKVAKVNVLPNGNAKDAEIHSSGFFGFFSTTYIVPADKLSVKGGRAAISMTSAEVKKLTK
jgi:PRC-barrel domain protein